MKIPRIGVGGTQLQTKSTQTIRPEGLDTSGRGLQALGQSVEKVGSDLYEKMNAARNFAEQTKADLYTTKKMGQLLLYADTDTTTDSTGKVVQRTGTAEDYHYYNEQISKGREEVAGLFTNKDMQATYLAEYDKQAIVTKAGIQKKFMSNLIDQGKADTLETVDNLTKAYGLTGNKVALDQIDQIMDSAVAQGFYSKTEGYKLKTNAVDNAKYQNFLSEFMIDPDGAAEKLKNNAYGLGVETKQKALTQLSELRRQLREDQNNNADDLTFQLYDKSLTFDQIDAMESSTDKRTAITKSDANSLRKALISSTKSDAEAVSSDNVKAKKYLELLDMFVDSDIDRTKFRQEIVKIYSDGIVSPEEGKVLTGLKRGVDDIVGAKQAEAAKKWVTNIRSIWRGKPRQTESSVRSLQDFLTRVQRGDDVNDAGRIVSSDAAKKYLSDIIPNIPSLPKEGETMQDEDGNIIRVYSDYTYRVE